MKCLRSLLARFQWNSGPAPTPMPISGQSSIDRKELLEFLSDARDFWETYHTRKENSVWLGTTFYLAAVGALALAFFNNSGGDFPDRPSRIFLIVGIVLTGIVVQLFVNGQQEDRQIAGAMVAGFGKALSVAIADASSFANRLEPSVYRPRPRTQPHKCYVLPHFVCSLLADKSLEKPEGIRWNYIAPVFVMTLWIIGTSAIVTCWPAECIGLGAVISCLLGPCYYIISAAIAVLGVLAICFNWAGRIPWGNRSRGVAEAPCCSPYLEPKLQPQAACEQSANKS